MIAGIVDGKVDTADVFFLIATILAFLAAILYAVGSRPVTDGRRSVLPWAPVLGWAAVGCAALAFFVL